MPKSAQGTGAAAEPTAGYPASSTRPTPRPRPKSKSRSDSRSQGAPLTPRGAFGLLRRAGSRAPGWWPLPLCLALGALGGTFYAGASVPQYTATSYVVVSPGKHSEPTSALGYAQAYGKIADDPAIVGAAEVSSGLPYGSLRGTVRASTSPDAPMIEITGTSPRSTLAAQHADAVARALTDTAKRSAKKTGAKLTVLSHAVAPDTAVSPSTPIALGVGGCAGALVGGLVLLARPQRRRTTGVGAPAVPSPSHGDGTHDMDHGPLDTARECAHHGADCGCENANTPAEPAR